MINPDKEIGYPPTDEVRKNLEKLYISITGALDLGDFEVLLQKYSNDLYATAKERMIHDIGSPDTESHYKQHIIKDEDALKTGVKSVIDEQLVRTAADNWGWFWVLVESFVLIAVTAVVLIVLQNRDYLLWCFIALSVELAFMFMYWVACVRGARRQVAAIVADRNRKKDITKYFRAL